MPVTSSSQLARPSLLCAWLLAARPKTLPAAIVPVLVGTAVSAHYGAPHWVNTIAALFGALLLQIASNFANDVYDYEKGADTEDRVGPLRTVQAGLIRPATMKGALGIVVLLAVGVGAYLYSVAGLPILAIGVSGILCAIAYTAGPYPLGYNGLGDLCVWLFFGFVAICGTTYVHLGWVPVEAWICAGPVGALATAILVVNNVRDYETDQRAGKRTLVVRLGRAAGLWEYRLLLGTAYAAPVVLTALDTNLSLSLVTWLTAPMAWSLDQRLRQRRGSALNPVLGRTAQLLLLYGMLLAASLYWTAAISDSPS